MFTKGIRSLSFSPDVDRDKRKGPVIHHVDDVHDESAAGRNLAPESSIGPSINPLYTSSIFLVEGIWEIFLIGGMGEIFLIGECGRYSLLGDYGRYSS